MPSPPAAFSHAYMLSLNPPVPSRLSAPGSHVTLRGRLLLYKAVKSGRKPGTEAGRPPRSLSGTGFGNEEEEEKKKVVIALFWGILFLPYGLNYYIKEVVHVICVNKQRWGSLIQYRWE